LRKVLVTGGAGFIGSHLVSALLARGDAVRVLDNFSSGRRENLAGLSAPGRARRLEVLEGDVRDERGVAEAVRGVEIVFHQAAFVSVPASLERPQECFEVNARGTCVVLEAARRAGVRRVVLASSAAVYGDAPALPLAEETPLCPLSPYAASKQVNEMYASLYTRLFDLEVVALRYFNVFGPRQRPDSMYAAAVPLFIQCLRGGEAPTVFGDGLQTRDLIFVADVARANLIAAEHPAAPGQVFNICSGRPTRLLDLLDILYRFFPQAPPPLFAAPRRGDIYQSLGDPSKAERLLGFKAEVSLVEGLRETAKWMP